MLTFTVDKDNKLINVKKSKEKGLYEDGEKTGEWLTYYDNGNIESKGSYISGDKDYIWEDKNGLWQYFYKNGILKEEGEFIVYESYGTKKNGRHGVWKEYHDNGQLKVELQYNARHWSSGKIVKGIYNCYDREGNLYQKVHYNNEGRKTKTEKF